MNIKKEFLDRQVSEFSKVGGKKGLLIRHKKIIELVLKYSRKDDLILDIGCFDGKILKALNKKGFRNLYGVDFSEVSKKSFGNSGIHFARCDIENDKIPFKERFDVVILTDVLEHFFSPQTILSKIKKNLSKDSKIIFSVPNAGWFPNGFILSFFPSKLFLSPAFGPWGHTYNFTFWEIKKISRELKFRIIELSGGRMDNYAFEKGIKKVFYELFLFILYPLALIYPPLFSDHIFGVLQENY